MTESRSVVSWSRKNVKQGKKGERDYSLDEILGLMDDCYLDYGDGIKSVYICQNSSNCIL